jgi:NAD(P)-dependent dehydrogenase (short-subunit alcohol dehydrogenase family)
MKNPGALGYLAAKHGVVGLIRGYANALAHSNIRVNTVHPSGTATPMIANEQMGQLLVDVPEYQSVFENLLPAPFIEAIDISEAMVYLCGRSGRYITGITPPVDAGYTAK